MTEQPLYVVRESKIHNKGVFTARDIKAGEKIIEYVGEKITKEESDERADIVLEESKNDKTKGAVYIFEIDDDWDIDGNVDWNPARYINHSCDPNCEAENDEGRIWIIALRDIPQGEELHYNYGYDWEDFDEHPCRCGTQKCVGFILDEDEWPRLQKLITNLDRDDIQFSLKK